METKPTGVGQANWEEEYLLTYGAARRGTGSENSPNGLDTYKGENIRTAGLVGEPVFKKLDVWNLSSPSIWKFPDILPKKMWCLPKIEQVPCAAPFDPRTTAIMNTATVFGPRQDLEDFPFDLLLTSRVYGWFTLLSLRSSYQNKLRSDMYPSTIGNMPWSDTLPAIAPSLEARRAPFLQACRSRYDAGAELERRVHALPLVPLKDAFKALAAKSDKLLFSASFDDGEPFSITLQDTVGGSDPATVVISEEGHSLTLPNEELARFFRLGIALHEGAEMSKSKLLGVVIPQDSETADALSALLASLDPVQAEVDVLAQVDAIDTVVGAALGLTPEEITFIQTDMRDDPFLSRVRPRYPFFTPAQRGRRTALESGARYGA